MAALAADPPSVVGGLAVTGVEQFPEAGLLRLWCGPVRLQIRPSGTEPALRVMVEGESESRVRRWAEHIAETVRRAAA